MLNPGSKGWINKYFDLVDKGEISLDIEKFQGFHKMQHMHMVFAKTGISYGYPLDFIYAKEYINRSWTVDEKMKFLLFECQLFVFIENNKGLDLASLRVKFIDKLYNYYGFHNGNTIPKLFQLFVKEQEKERRIEKILKERVHINMNLFHNKWWVRSMNNTFCYIDVILFDEYLFENDIHAIKDYNNYAKNAMIGVILSANSDGDLQRSERSIFNVFLASADLKPRTERELKDLLLNGAGFDDFSDILHENWLLKRFVIDISILTIISNSIIDDTETELLVEMSTYLSVSMEELEDSLSYAESFMIHTQNQHTYTKDSSSYNKVYHNLTKRWTKILHRNKEKIVLEIQESKELIHLIKKHKKEGLTHEEKELMKFHFHDVLKTIPSMVIFLVPGGSLLLPLILKIVPDLLPSAFRSNQVDDK